MHGSFLQVIYYIIARSIVNRNCRILISNYLLLSEFEINFYFSFKLNNKILINIVSLQHNYLYQICIYCLFV